jgi:GT2 family glycosyltransferase
MMSRFPVDLVLVTWGRQDMTNKTIRAIHQNTDRRHFRLIVIDNGSDLEMATILTQWKIQGLIDELVFNDANRGLEPARNQGLALVQSDLFVCVDNDCLIQRPVDGKDWLEMMMELMDKYQGYGAISARTQVMIGTGNIFEGKEHEELVEFPHPGGSFRIMRTEAVRGIGGWREDSSGRGAEERYICGRLSEAGWQTGFAVGVKCLHLHGARGDQATDSWGYPKGWTPEMSGHSPNVWHPIFERGDDEDEVREYLDD